MLSPDEFTLLQLKVIKGKELYVTIISESMSPLIKVNERIKVIHKKTLKPFDIVVYYNHKNQLVCHYIWKRSHLDETAYLLRSLKGKGFDLPVQEKNILGYVPEKQMTARWKALIFFRLLLLLLVLVLLSAGCSKAGYLWEQASGQVALQLKGQSNESVLEDPKTPEKQKEKIRQIIKYKKFFYNYFHKEPSDIYSKTVLLETDEVVHLVVASQYHEVKPLEHCFWLMGCFPYLGFFKKESALKFEKELKEKDIYTFKRPVHAYSTLGYFEDSILSSFFHYDKFELAELIFHELFHTIFFVKNQVELNENLANYFGKQLAIEFFKNRPPWLARKHKYMKAMKKIKQVLVQKTHFYNESLKKNPPTSKKMADQRLEEFLSKNLRSALQNICRKENIAPCWPAQRAWNNASLSAYLTYENRIIPIEKLHNSLGLSLKDFFLYLEKHSDTIESIIP